MRELVEMSSIISSILQLLTKFCSMKESENNNIGNVTIAKDKKSLVKANDYAEHALLIAEHYSLAFTPKDRRRFNYLLKQYRKYN